MKNKIIIPYGDSAHVTCGILIRQLNGLYWYLPKEGDKLRISIIKNCRVIYQQEINPTVPYDKPVQIDLNLELHPGKYLYDIRLLTDNDIYTIVNNDTLIIE